MGNATRIIMPNAAFTIIANNYLPFARVLTKSLRDQAPDLLRIVILVDKPQGHWDPALEDFHVVLSEDLGIPDSNWFHFKYTVLELSTAVKPYAAQHIFEHYSVDRLLYFDPDINIYCRPDDLLTSLNSYSIVLTPHLTAPIDDDRRPGDLDILRSGSYNLGFIGLRRNEETMRFLRWWQEKLFDHCVVDLAKGLFVDQRWIDLVPGMFAGVGILRNPGLNVAYWNIANRKITRTPSGFLVNGEPLCFFHFSGFDPDNPHAFSKHQDRFSLDDLGDASELALDYSRRLFDSGYSQCKRWPYAFGFFSNGLPIPDMGRAAHHEAPELISQVSDPFSAEGFRAFLEVWNSFLKASDGKASGVTRLAYRIYRARADVQIAMPDIFNGDLVRFLNWILSSGRTEHTLSDEFLAPIRDALHQHKSTIGHDPHTYKDPVVNDRIVQVIAKTNLLPTGGTPIQVDALNAMTSGEDSLLALSQLARIIYTARPDLQRMFPDPTGQDAVKFLVWFLTYGAYEYRLADSLIAPLGRQLPSVFQSLESPFHRLWYRSVLLFYTGWLRMRNIANTPRATIRSSRTAIPAKHLDSSIPGTAPPKLALAVRPQLDTPALPAGLNFIGYVRAEMGVGESVRCAIRAAQSCGMRISVKSVDPSGPFRQLDSSIDQAEDGCPYPVNVFHVNADQSELILQTFGDAFNRGKYNIGYWAWELEDFPDRWTSAFRYFDEIWTPSTFCQTAIAHKSPIPVVRIPHAIHIDDCARIDRSSFTPEPHEFVFLAIFDLLSVMQRKNPIGLLKAFRRAFEGAPGYRLILKINHGQHKMAEMQSIREAAAGLPVTVIDYTMPRSEVNGLIQMSDCVVSLHRSEGFGLTIAEAMYLNKPVIATGYSGNVDFTKPKNAFLVDYDMVTVPKGCDPYDEGALWAEPRLEHAACQMRLVATEPVLRATRANEAKQYIQSHFSPESVGKLMLNRLGSARSRHSNQGP